MRRYVRARDEGHFITDIVMAADALVSVPVPPQCHTAETKALADAVQALRWHTAGLERGARMIKKHKAEPKVTP